MGGLAQTLRALCDRCFPRGFIFLTDFHFLFWTASSVVPLSQVIAPFFTVYEELLVFFGFWHFWGVPLGACCPEW